MLKAKAAYITARLKLSQLHLSSTLYISKENANEKYFKMGGHRERTRETSEKKKEKEEKAARSSSLSVMLSVSSSSSSSPVKDNCS